MTRKKSKVVFSTQTGDQRKKSVIPTGLRTSLPPAQQNLKVMREKKGRRGKVVTVVSGFVLTQTDLKTLSKTLKTFCGSGGTIKGRGQVGQVIEVQGDHRAKIAKKLQDLGYKVKLAGG